MCGFYHQSRNHYRETDGLVERAVEELLTSMGQEDLDSEDGLAEDKDLSKVSFGMKAVHFYQLIMQMDVGQEDGFKYITKRKLGSCSKCTDYCTAVNAETRLNDRK